MRRLFKIPAIIVAIGVLIAAFKAYFLRSYYPATQAYYDGLGRVLSDPPIFLRFIFGGRPWAGIGWHLVDIIWFFGGLSLAYWLYSLSD